MSEQVSKIAFLWAIIKTRGKDKLFENALRELGKCNKFMIVGVHLWSLNALKKQQH